METVYKVVKVDESSGKRYSCMGWWDSPDTVMLSKGITLEYIQGRITKPKFGKIIAFDNLTDANSFAEYMTLFEIWRCTAPRTYSLLTAARLTSDIMRYWVRHSKVDTMRATRGSVACPQVCLKELLIRNG